MKCAIALLVWVLGGVCGDECVRGGSYQNMFGKCYHLFLTPLSYTRAQQVCSGIYGHLVSIGNAFEQAYVVDLATKKFGSVTDYWIGLAVDPDDPTTFVWDDGNTLNYTNWATGYPSSMSLSCVASASLGRWYNRDCEFPKLPFMCQVYAREDAPPEKCPGLGLYNSLFGKCYYFMKSLQSASDAATTCSGIDGVLVNLDQKLKQDFISQEVRRREMEADFWIGFRYDGSNWKWSNSTEYSYTNWEQGFPANSAALPCTAAYYGDGKWHNTVCDDGEQCNIVCEVYAEKDTATVNPDAWDYFNVTKSWYKVLYDDDLNWYDFESRCVSENGHLASVHSKEENEFIHGILMETYGFLGLNSPNEFPYQWTWSDGTAFDYENWYATYPTGGYFCAVMESDWNTEKKGSLDGFWMNDFCQYDLAHHAGVCKRTVAP